MAAMNHDEETSTASTMCGNRQLKAGLKMTSNQFVGWNWPLTSLYATGVCIHEFAERIHAVDSSAPSATIQDAMATTFLLTRPSPEMRMPMKPASRKKAVRASVQINGPRIGPV